jgi:uncharacterized Zn finger protein (UPF0148 family)
MKTLVATAIQDVCPRCGLPRKLLTLHRGGKVCADCVTAHEVGELVKGARN